VIIREIQYYPVRDCEKLRSQASTEPTEPKWRSGHVLTASSAEHVHDYDEYMVVVQGCYALIINGERIQVKAGNEYVIPRGVPHSAEVVAESPMASECVDRARDVTMRSFLRTTTVLSLTRSAKSRLIDNLGTVSHLAGFRVDQELSPWFHARFRTPRSTRLSGEQRSCTSVSLSPRITFRATEQQE
jgi:mannose-6-phosphate isomerase-like protein (cupin superfamily)